MLFFSFFPNKFQIFNSRNINLSCNLNLASIQKNSRVHRLQLWIENMYKCIGFLKATLFIIEDRFCSILFHSIHTTSFQLLLTSIGIHFINAQSLVEVPPKFQEKYMKVLSHTCTAWHESHFLYHLVIASTVKKETIFRSTQPERILLAFQHRSTIFHRFCRPRTLIWKNFLISNLFQRFFKK